MDKLAIDVGDIQSRLIDHRPVVQGEICYFMNLRKNLDSERAVSWTT
ncbi:unnamed protein product [Oncorhynchus mykiss]|uniref:Biogenesis of lysosome-related organelles complex 1 subunit 5 n=1 Tax=Oncorhynchus mykiss TaxID=8022 RepID=A0A060Y0F0_ONCMY|nr:unnamed protein product [Oncorhynchus mykiss]